MQDRIHRDMNIGLHQRNNHEVLKKDIRKHQLYIMNSERDKTIFM